MPCQGLGQGASSASTRRARLERLLKVALICATFIRSHIMSRMIWGGGDGRSLGSVAVAAEIFLSRGRGGEVLVLGEPLGPSPQVQTLCGYVLGSGSQFDSDFVSFAQRLIDARA